MFEWVMTVIMTIIFLWNFYHTCQSCCKCCYVVEQTFSLKQEFTLYFPIFGFIINIQWAIMTATLGIYSITFSNNIALVIMFILTSVFGYPLIMIGIICSRIKRCSFMEDNSALLYVINQIPFLLFVFKCFLLTQFIVDIILFNMLPGVAVFASIESQCVGVFLSLFIGKLSDLLNKLIERYFCELKIIPFLSLPPDNPSNKSDHQIV
eukprot:UN03578